MEFIGSLRRLIGRLILRGWLLDAWVNWKTRRIETQYLGELIAASRRQQSTASDAPGIGHKEPLRRMLFIADAQWELKELVPELRKICPVEVLDLRPHLRGTDGPNTLARGVTKTLADFIGAHKSLEPDLILFYARPALLSEETFELLHGRWTCPLLGMNLDEKMQFLKYDIFADKNDDYQRWARQFDLNLSNVRVVVDWYQDRNLPVYYMPEGYHPKLELRIPDATAQFEYEIAFVGSVRPERKKLVRELRRRGVPVEPFGDGWERSAEGAYPEKIYRASMINLGIGLASPSVRLATLKTRDFECPGSGSCYLTTYNWELALHYEIGKEILCYRTVEELIELFSYHRRRPKDCLEIARAAYRRCLTDHTWEKRFRDLFQHVGLKVTCGAA